MKDGQAMSQWWQGLLSLCESTDPELYGFLNEVSTSGVAMPPATPKPTVILEHADYPSKRVLRLGIRFSTWISSATAGEWVAAVAQPGASADVFRGHQMAEFG
jgi:hypothetical protein